MASVKLASALALVLTIGLTFNSFAEGSAERPACPRASPAGGSARGVCCCAVTERPKCNPNPSCPANMVATTENVSSAAPPSPASMLSPAPVSASGQALTTYLQSTNHSGVALAYALIHVGASLFIYVLVVAIALFGLYIANKQFNWWIESQRRLLALLAQGGAAENSASEAGEQSTPSLERSDEPEPGESQGQPEPAKAATSPPLSHAELTNRIEFTENGIVVVTPIIGITILVLDLAFFYLFVRYVWPTL